MVIFLIGFMGSGKSFWAHRLAERLGIPHYDLDEAVSAAEGMEIPDLFKEKGEHYFRKAERTVLEQLVADLPPVTEGVRWAAVIACGGGTPCFFDTMDWMNRHGLTVWLNPSAEQLAARLLTETASRPLLAGKTGADLEELIGHLMEERRSYYKKAHIEIKNTHLALDEFVNILLHASHLP
jgi:shikimate kinase